MITVDETFDNDHRVVSKREHHSGRFTFTAADAGQHKICFTPDTDVQTSGWLSSAQGAVKVSLDLAIGETSKIETEDKDKMKDIVQRVKDLNSRLHDIRREQVYQRVSILSSPTALIKHIAANRATRNIYAAAVCGVYSRQLLIYDSLIGT
jgi:hypothetical protein